MKVKCEYCDSFISDTADFCPNCGAPNANVMRNGDGIPKTIEELLEFCNSKGMNLKQMRFFIGENYRGPKAFGIYKDGDDFIVYKNKADGSRAVRYRGTDEAYAVNEIYQKLWTEVQTRRAKDIAGSGNGSSSGNGTEANRSSTDSSSGNSGGCMGWLASKMKGVFIVLIVMAIASCIASKTPNKGYYTYNNNKYYYQNGAWYVYDTVSNAWNKTNADSSLEDNYSDYYDSSSYSSSYGNANFEDSSWYDDDSDWDSSSWDYDYGSWDSGGSDWDSDW